MKMRFRELLLESIDEGFNSLGDELKEIVYFLLEKSFMLNEQNIPDQIDDFSESIDCIFGFGSNILKIIIMKILFRKIGCSIPLLGNQETFNFANYLRSAKVAYSRTLVQPTPNRDKRISLTQIL